MPKKLIIPRLVNDTFLRNIPFNDVDIKVDRVYENTYKLEAISIGNYIPDNLTLNEQRTILQEMKEKAMEQLVDHLLNNNFINIGIEYNLMNRTGKNIRFSLYIYINLN